MTSRDRALAVLEKAGIVMQALDLTDPNARPEYDAYVRLAGRI